MKDSNSPDKLDMGEKGLMNRAKGTAEEIKGRAHSAAGGLVGDTSEQVKGAAEQLKGHDVISGLLGPTVGRL